MTLWFNNQFATTIFEGRMGTKSFKSPFEDHSNTFSTLLYPNPFWGTWIQATFFGLILENFIHFFHYLKQKHIAIYH